MVRIINYKERESEDGKAFFVLEIQGGVEMVKSQNTQKFYVTARKTTIPSTFDEGTCKAMIGQELPGRIEKVDCEPYEYTIKETGELVHLTYRYEYMPEESIPEKVERSNTTIDEVVTFQDFGEPLSANGVE